jgi:hypothetical protein
MKSRTTLMGEVLIQLIRDVVGDSPESGAEIGVFRGETSCNLIQAFPQCKFYFVDPWMVDESYKAAHLRTGKLTDSEWTAIAEQAKTKIRTFSALHSSPYPVIYQMTSEVAAMLVPLHSLDFCFIDGDHRYESVKRDIELWRPRTRILLCGHDYGGKHHKGVDKAVDEAFGDAVIAPGWRIWGVDLRKRKDK